MADTRIEALRASVARLHALTLGMTEGDLARQAYPAEWTIADVLSHLGSGAVIHQRRLHDVLAGQDTPDEFSRRVWDEWNAKSPTAKRDDALAADAVLLAHIDAVTPDEREKFELALGAIAVDFDGFVGLRLNEHAVHTWDIDVVAEPSATIPAQLAELVVDNLGLIARFTGKPTGETATITIATTDPDRGFRVALTPEGVTFDPTTETDAADVRLAAEAFVRLVYGRLDAKHTPAGNHGTALDTLRHVFPGP